MKILITGGAGYIGSHTALKLIEAGHHVLILDNLSNSYINSIKAIETITNSKVPFFQGDIRSLVDLEEIFQSTSFDSVIHFAASKAIAESVEFPLKYYDNNILGSINLLNVMKKYEVKSLVFSSSASVYGEAVEIPIHEDNPKNPTNPYGRSKLIFENILSDLAYKDKNWKIASLRYFNPIGAHNSGKLGESPLVPHNIMPIIFDVINGKRKSMYVYGNDYPTEDGTCIRDYLHVEDLVDGHVAALSYLESNSGISFFNLGTGKGTSVLELLNQFMKVTKSEIKIEFAPRREGDVATLYTSPEKAFKCMNWKTNKNLEEMCEDTWRWIRNNPEGFKF